MCAAHFANSAAQIADLLHSLPLRYLQFALRKLPIHQLRSAYLKLRCAVSKFTNGAAQITNCAA